MSSPHPLNQAVIAQALHDLRNGQLRRCKAMGFGEEELDALKHPALVSVLAVQPSVLVCDEPTTLLDLRNRNLVAQVLADLPHQVIIATHDLELAAQSERVIVIDAGRVVADGDPETAIAAYRALLA